MDNDLLNVLVSIKSRGSGAVFARAPHENKANCRGRRRDNRKQATELLSHFWTEAKRANGRHGSNATSSHWLQEVFGIWRGFQITKERCEARWWVKETSCWGTTKVVFYDVDKSVVHAIVFHRTFSANRASLSPGAVTNSHKNGSILNT